MNNPAVELDPVSPSAYPTLQAVQSAAPAMPPSWSGVALLHPFSPPLSTDPTPDNPFFQLSVANIACVAGSYFSAQISGCDYGNWWYMVTRDGTFVSTDQGASWTGADLGWSLPQNWFGAQIDQAACAGSSPLNWMPGPRVDWWKVPVNPVPGTPSAATWMWFDSSTEAPVRMMFGQGPPTPVMGDPTQLALFQMFSMSYLPEFSTQAPAQPPSVWTPPSFAGFQKGNPNNYPAFTWNTNFGMTAFMTPVNESFNPLPTRVLYVWKPDAEYVLASDRSQNTRMVFNYNQFPGQPIGVQEALLTGPAPQGIEPPQNSATSFLINYNTDGTQACHGSADGFDFPQEPPNWVSRPGVQGTLRATITNNAVLCPNTVVTVFSVLFPPSGTNYPEATYLWTWYAPQDASGEQSRPVTFMQSQSGINKGTSLALADYFYYEAFSQPIDPANFAVPACCPLPQARSKQ